MAIEDFSLPRWLWLFPDQLDIGLLVGVVNDYLCISCGVCVSPPPPSSFKLLNNLSHTPQLVSFLLFLFCPYLSGGGKVD